MRVSGFNLLNLKGRKEEKEKKQDEGEDKRG